MATRIMASRKGLMLSRDFDVVTLVASFVWLLSERDGQVSERGYEHGDGNWTAVIDEAQCSSCSSRAMQ